MIKELEIDPDGAYLWPLCKTEPRIKWLKSNINKLSKGL